ncbi:hypothetical protein BW13_06850 [Bifidobacterium sp. UTCIF-37]|nr:hypothetical protein BW13_06850 [Bifidobacterium sp. UTCIF-37]TPF88433.1 hypothetical protein BW11_07425 [Bifidobacterium sp. UTCIF-38]
MGSVQRGILDLYRQDIAKYAATKMHIRSIFDAIPSQLDKKNKRFVLADLSKSARMERYASDFRWLADAGVVIPCRNVTEPVSPLKINEHRSLMKVFMADVGLLSAFGMGDARRELLTGDAGINWGSFLENLIAQELLAHGLEPYYYDRARIGEADFLIEQNGQVIPIEAKSGKGYTRHAALNNLLAVREWGLGQAIVLCADNVSVDDDQPAITYMPWYMTMFIEKPQPEHIIIEEP